jgi:hypothetical protein
MDVLIEAPRYSIEPSADGVRVVIPPRRNWLAIIFFGVWLAGWFLGERNALLQLEHAQSAFLSVWLVMWTVGGVVVASLLMWQLGGREVILADSVSISQRIEAFGIGLTRNYTLSECRDLRAVPRINNPAARRQALFPWSADTGFGSIAFDYGARTIRFAPGLDEAEAKMLVADLSRRIKVPPTLVSML